MLRHDHLSICTLLLGSVGWRLSCMTVARRVHLLIIVHGRLLRVCGLLILSSHLGVSSLCRRVRLCLSGLCPLLAQCFSLLLLLGAWRRRPIQRARLQIHGRHERTSELLLGDEWVELGLLRGPTFQRVDVEKTPNEIDKGDSVIHFYKLR